MTRSRRLSAALLALTLLLALSGCVKLDMDMDIRADNTVDGTLIMAVDSEVLTALGVSEADILKQLETQGPFSGADRPKQGSITQKSYNSDGKIGQVYTFTDVPLSEFGGAQDGFSITRKGDRFFVTGIVDMSTGTPTDPQEKAIADRFGKKAETRIRMTFPGEVLESNGKIDGRSVTWNPKIGEKTPISAEARTTAIIPVLLAAVGGAALFLLIVGLVIFFVVRSRRRRRNAGGNEYPSGYGQQPPSYQPAGYQQPPAYEQQTAYQQPPYPQPPPYPQQPPPPSYPQAPAAPPPRPADATRPLPRVDPSQPWPPGQ